MSSFRKIEAYEKVAEDWDLTSPAVILTEKIDGSCFTFRKQEDGTLVCHSKNTLLDPTEPLGQFKPVMDHLLAQDLSRIPANITYAGETLATPRHNRIRYDRVPKGHLVLFAYKDEVSNGPWAYDYEFLDWIASFLNVEVVAPQMTICEPESSMLGGPIEGVVFKNLITHAQCKLVKKEFKEVKKIPMPKSQKWEEYKECYRTEARWQKAKQHLEDAGRVVTIPDLIKEVMMDVDAEEQESIKEWLWKYYGKELKKHIVKGLGDWFNEKRYED